MPRLYRIGVLGGTFNPIHNSHLYIAGEYARLLNLDKIIFMPTNTPPHKSAVDVAPAGMRLEMCALACKGNPQFSVCDFEVLRREKSFTYLTLKFLRKRYPQDELFLLTGADMFLTVQDWKKPERIFECATLCAAAREPGELQALRAHVSVLEPLGAKCMVIEVVPKPLSSTMIRTAAANGADISGMVPPPVADYIRSNGLYRDAPAYVPPDNSGYMDILRAMLGEKRLSHSIAVAKRAKELALIYGADAAKAATAGLLHDICHDMPKERQLKYIHDHGIMLDNFYQSHHHLWHAVCSEIYLREELGITDKAILDAVRYHTTGRAGMSMLEKVIFVADGTSEERDFPGVNERRLSAESSLDCCMAEFLSFELQGLLENGKTIIPDALDAYNDVIVRVI